MKNSNSKNAKLKSIKINNFSLDYSSKICYQIFYGTFSIETKFILIMGKFFCFSYFNNGVCSEPKY